MQLSFDKATEACLLRKMELVSYDSPEEKTPFFFDSTVRVVQAGKLTPIGRNSGF